MPVNRKKHGLYNRRVFAGSRHRGSTELVMLCEKARRVISNREYGVTSHNRVPTWLKEPNTQENKFPSIHKQMSPKLCIFN